MIFRLNNTGTRSDLMLYVEKLKHEGFDIECKGEEFFESYYIEINNIDDLLFLMNVVKKELIITDNYIDRREVIEIYDDYRE